MGIPGFFNSISKNYNIAINNKLQNIHIFLDFNSLIYTAKYIVYNILINYIKFKLNLEYDTKTEFDKILSVSVLDLVCLNYLENINEKDGNDISNIRNEMILNTILNLVKNIYSQISNISSFNIYLDGVPFIGKMIEQRKRTLLSGLINRGRELLIQNLKIDPKTKFINIIIDPFINLDKSVIKPGTYFMTILEEWLNNTFKDNIIEHIQILSPKFTQKNWSYSGFLESGEAEHKIMDKILTNSYSDILVYSPDADMIILLLPLTNINIYLVRDSVDGLVYSLSKLKDDIITNIKEINSSNLEFNEQRLILDIAFIYNIFGNDFLPKLDNVNIYDKSTIKLVLKQYVKYFEDIKDYLIDENNDINWYNYVKYLYYLNNIFTHPKIEKLYKNKTILSKDNFTDQIYSLQNFNRGLYDKNEDKYIWNKNFYENSQFFDDENKENIIKDYLIGIIMIMILYSKIYKHNLNEEEKRIVKLWYYQHHKSPLIIDIHTFLNKFINKNKFDKEQFKKEIRNHIVSFFKNFNIVEITPTKQLYYITPIYDDFIKLTNADTKLFPKIEEHLIYEEYISQLYWDKIKLSLNIVELVDCNGQRYIDKCVPLLKSKKTDKYINLIFDINRFIK